MSLWSPSGVLRYGLLFPRCVSARGGGEGHCCWGFKDKAQKNSIKSLMAPLAPRHKQVSAPSTGKAVLQAESESQPKWKPKLWSRRSGFPEESLHLSKPISSMVALFSRGRCPGRVGSSPMHIKCQALSTLPKSSKVLSYFRSIHYWATSVCVVPVWDKGIKEVWLVCTCTLAVQTAGNASYI